MSPLGVRAGIQRPGIPIPGVGFRPLSNGSEALTCSCARQRGTASVPSGSIVRGSGDPCREPRAAAAAANEQQGAGALLRLLIQRVVDPEITVRIERNAGQGRAAL